MRELLTKRRGGPSGVAGGALTAAAVGLALLAGACSSGGGSGPARTDASGAANAAPGSPATNP
ncbi:MAG TPA: hypothetical protein VGL92_06580, partial [Acidimicrobiia bacterium]